VSVDGQLFLAHRVIWVMIHGSLPDGYEIDHRDQNASNNRLPNLRLATPSQNSANIRVKSNNSLGIKGVYWLTANRKFRAQIRVAGRKIHLGLFDTAKEAAEAYAIAAKSAYGEFASL
jgi:hypothetical protein